MRKVCNTCNIEKDASAFNKMNKDKTGLQHNCRDCTKAYKKKWCVDRADYIRDQELIKKYGITLTMYKEMLQEQGGKCKICGTTRCPSGHSLCVDHCHNTGKVRGLLCKPCNSGLGKFRDNINSLKKAIKYLEDNHE